MSILKKISNKNGIIIYFIVWFVASTAGYLILNNSVKRLNNDFYQNGLLITQKIVDFKKTEFTSNGEETSESLSSLILGKDTLSLNNAIVEIENSENLISAAILNHENRFIAHTNSDMIDEMLAPIENAKLINTIDDIIIEAGTSSDSEKIVSFSTNIFYGKTKIGKVYLAFSSIYLDRFAYKYKVILIGAVACSGLLFLVFLAVISYTPKIKTFVKTKTKPKTKPKKHKDENRIGPYILRKKIAKGGMAELFLADYMRDDGFRRVVAVKKILPHLIENTEFINMFIREARLAALLQHPNIVQINDFGRFQDIYYIAMEYVSGKNLAEIVTAMKSGLPVDQSIFLILQISRGLQYSHSKTDDKTGEPLNIVHRDISPQNILVSFQGEVKISDFGISKARSEPSLTIAGQIKGKLSYMSPEQALGKDVDHQADIYALGIVFYEILSGKKLYKFNTDIEAIRAIPEKEVAPIIKLRDDIPDELNDIVMKCLEKDKTARYQNALDIHDDLVNLKTKLNINYDRLSLENFMKEHFNK